MPRGDEPSDDGGQAPEVNPTVETIVAWYWLGMKTLLVVIPLVLLSNPVYCQLTAGPDPGDVAGDIHAQHTSTVQNDVGPEGVTVVEFSNVSLREITTAVQRAADSHDGTGTVPFTYAEEDRIHSSGLGEPPNRAELYVRYNDRLYWVTIVDAHEGQDGSAFVVCA